MSGQTDRPTRNKESARRHPEDLPAGSGRHRLLTKHRDLTVRSMPSEHRPRTCSPPRSARRVAPTRSGLGSKAHPARCRSTRTSSTHSSAGGSCAARSPSWPTIHFGSRGLAGARATASFQDAGGQLSIAAVMRIVRPIMPAADVPVERAHPHALRLTFGRLDMAAPKAELSRLQRITGHASPETTSRYVDHDDHELAARHRRIERAQRRPARQPRGASAGASRRHGGGRGGLPQPPRERHSRRRPRDGRRLSCGHNARPGARCRPPPVSSLEVRALDHLALCWWRGSRPERVGRLLLLCLQLASLRDRFVGHRASGPGGLLGVERADPAQRQAVGQSAQTTSIRGPQICATPDAPTALRAQAREAIALRRGLPRLSSCDRVDCLLQAGAVRERAQAL
jgi:integrase-like protein